MPTESDGLKELDLLVESAIADATQAARELMAERETSARLRHQLREAHAKIGRIEFENRTLRDREVSCHEHP